MSVRDREREGEGRAERGSEIVHDFIADDI